MPRKIRDESDAITCLNAVEASGLARADWAHQHGIDARSLNAWRLKLRRIRPSLRLVELVATPTPPARYLLRFDGLELELDDHFREDTLARLLAVVSRC